MHLVSGPLRCCPILYRTTRGTGTTDRLSPLPPLRQRCNPHVASPPRSPRPPLPSLATHTKVSPIIHSIHSNSHSSAQPTSTPVPLNSSNSTLSTPIHTSYSPAHSHPTSTPSAPTNASDTETFQPPPSPMPVPPLNIAVYGTGHVDPVSSTTFHALATSAPEGIYTAAGLRKVDAGWAVVDWVLHLARLKLSLEVMHDKGKGYYDKLFHWIPQQGEEGLEEALRTKLNPLVKQALAALAESGWEGDAMLTLLIQDIQAKGGSDSVNNGMDSNSMDSDASTAPVNVWVFISSVTVPRGDVPVPVCVMGAPRPASDAHAKYALWIEQRRGLEARKPEGVGEILLADNNGLITEGLVTNFFVVVEMQEDAGSSASSQPVVMTAGEGALYGILRRRVEDACNRIGIPLLHQAPQSGERASWQEAFVTNCIRGVQPVSRVYCPEDNHWQHEPWEHSLPQPYGPITQAVQHALRSVQQLTFETDL